MSAALTWLALLQAASEPPAEPVAPGAVPVAAALKLQWRGRVLPETWGVTGVQRRPKIGHPELGRALYRCILAGHVPVRNAGMAPDVVGQPHGKDETQARHRHGLRA